MQSLGVEVRAFGRVRFMRGSCSSHLIRFEEPIHLCTEAENHEWSRHVQKEK